MGDEDDFMTDQELITRERDRLRAEIKADDRAGGLLLGGALQTDAGRAAARRLEHGAAGAGAADDRAPFRDQDRPAGPPRM